MRKLLIISMLCLAACGQQMRSARANYKTDPAFNPYIELYVQMKGRGLSYDIPVIFSTLSGNTIGLCTRWSSGERLIQVDPTYWSDEYVTEDERISLIFHELGHCDLNRGHDNSFMSNGWPTSLMYPYNYGYPSTLESYYFDELFNPSSSHIVSSTASHGECVHDIEVEPETSSE